MLAITGPRRWSAAPARRARAAWALRETDTVVHERILTRQVERIEPLPPLGDATSDEGREQALPLPGWLTLQLRRAIGRDEALAAYVAGGRPPAGLGTRLDTTA